MNVKIVYGSCGLRNKSETDLYNDEHYSRSSKNKVWRKNSGLHGIWTHDLELC